MKLSKTIGDELRVSFNADCEQSRTLDQLEKTRVAYLGRAGKLTELFHLLKTLSLDERRTYGPLLDELRSHITEQLAIKKGVLEREQYDAEQAKLPPFDCTAYLPQASAGSLHPYTHIIQRISDIFSSMGYEYAVGPEVETEWYNFEALNIPANHPARDMHDTFWLASHGLLLRTHTSSIEIRTLMQRKPPIALFAPGRVFRHEATDATHDFMFMQCEGLVVDKDISLAHLCGTLKLFMRSLFDKKNITIRLRPSYFPFVEPGVEVDISCLFCTQGCPVCKKTGWIELAGAGLTHPNVLKNCGIDPQEYSGFAFGFGIERLAMLFYGIHDIRIFHANKLEILEQF